MQVKTKCMLPGSLRLSRHPLSVRRILDIACCGPHDTRCGASDSYVPPTMRVHGVSAVYFRRSGNVMLFPRDMASTPRLIELVFPCGGGRLRWPMTEEQVKTNLSRPSLSHRPGCKERDARANPSAHEAWKSPNRSMDAPERGWPLGAFDELTFLTTLSSRMRMLEDARFAQS